MLDIKYLTYNQEVIDQINSIVSDWKSGKERFTVRTSGSTGPPKEIEFRREHMENSARMTLKALKIQKGQTALLCLSPATIGGKMMIIRAIVGELRLLVVEANRNPLELIEETIDLCAMVPLQVNSTLDKSLEKLLLVKNLIIGGADLDQKRISVLQTIPVHSYQTFGMTETISHIALKPLWKKDSLYKVLPGIQIETTDDDRLVITALGLGVDHLITNDVVNTVSTSEFNWIGRSDFVINSGGIKIHPEHIESKLTHLISAPFFISSEASEEFGESVVLAIETEDASSLPSKDLLLSCLNKFEVPKKIRFGMVFDYTVNGKLDRLKTRTKLINAKERVL